MIFINEKADYSGVSIGKVVIPHEFDPITSAILEHYTKPLSSNRMIALDNLIVAIKDCGAWFNTTDIFIPAIAANIHEAFFNAMTNTEGNDVDGPYLYNEGVVIDKPSASVSLNAQTHHVTSTSFSVFGLFHYTNNTSIATRIGVNRDSFSISGNGQYVVSLSDTAINGQSTSYTKDANNVVNINVLSPTISDVDDVELYVGNEKSTLTKAANFVAKDVSAIIGTKKIGVGYPLPLNVSSYNNNPLYLMILAQDLTNSQMAAMRSAIINFEQEFFAG